MFQVVKNNMEYYTYLYIDPKTNLPVYIGKGKNDRARRHNKNSHNVRLGRLLNKRKSEGFMIEPIINYEVDEIIAYEMEKFWINFYGREDLKLGTLFNKTDGGDAPPNGKGRKQSDETKEKKRNANLGHKHTEETKQKIRDKRVMQVNLACSIKKRGT